ncbi:MAG: flagellar hook-associated protein FlgK [Cellulomonas sp.]|nr:flagellar hook-associated protein FlgK [Cellulomonas sp.]
MSTFSGISTALSSLIAQRQALEVSGQNIANSNTVGYTRQRASISSLPAASVSSMFSTNNGPGQGTQVTGIERLGDVFIDTRVRTETAGSAYLSARSSAYTTLEQSVGEPSTTGLAAQLSTLWAGFHDVGNTPDKDSARSALLESAKAVVDRIATLYSAAGTQWTQARTTTVALVDQVNTTAANVADLNTRILSITNTGGSANELMDQRDLLVTQLSGLVGATARVRDNGTVDVLVAGNALVSGATTKALTVTGPTLFSGATAGGAVGAEWASRPGVAVGLDGGRVAGLLSVLAPPAGGNGGMLTEAAASYDALATKLANSVNALHSGATTVGGATGINFFAIDATKPAALGLSVAITLPSDIAVATPGKGALDGSVADKIATLGTAADGPDAAWSSIVVQLGVRTASGASRATVAEASRASAASQQLAQMSVSTDEESTNMLAYQRAYEGSARVLTAIDAMLDTLINRTGLVGR